MWKLSTAQKDEVVTRYVAGASAEALGRRFGVSCCAIGGLLFRRGIVRRDASARMRRLSLDQHAFSVLTPEARYWAGFLMADGSIVGNEVALVLSERDTAHVLSFREFLKSEHALTPIVRDKSLRFSVHSNLIVADLARIGVLPRKTYEAHCSEAVAQCRDFWRGVVDGDGWIGLTSNGRARLELVGAQPLLQQFANFVNLRCGSCVTVQPHKSIWRVGLTGITAARAIAALYLDGAVSLARKRNASLNILRAGTGAGVLNVIGLR